MDFFFSFSYFFLFLIKNNSKVGGPSRRNGRRLTLGLLTQSKGTRMDRVWRRWPIIGQPLEVWRFMQWSPFLCTVLTSY